MKQTTWPTYQLILFRFFFIYFTLSTALWSWMGSFPWFEFLSAFDTTITEGYTNFFNSNFFQIKEELVPTLGSGDTSMGWATLYSQLCLSLLGMVIWSIADRKRLHYQWPSLIIRNVVRYYVILFAFLYGVTKVFPLQMSPPSNSYYATDLGHFSAMRFS